VTGATAKCGGQQLGGEPEGPHSWGLSKGSREVSARSTSVSDGAIRD